MSLRQVYEDFLANPTADALSADVALNYITTTTQFTTPEGVIKHLTSQERVVKKKSHNVVNVVEGANSLCLDVELTIQFMAGGGAYLLTLDDNFLIERVVTFPMIHIVHFDSQNKISQIRLYWDQGSLLKQVEVIGARNRSWPITEGKDQTRMINASIAAAPKISSPTNPVAGPTTSVPPLAQPKQNDDDAATSRPMSPGKRHLKDPHASLSLFTPPSPTESEAPKPTPASSRISAKPPPRDYSELFVGSEESTPTKAGASPRREDVIDRPIAPKAGSSARSYDASRLFGGEEPPAEKLAAPSKKPDPRMYGHFEFGETPLPKQSAPNPRASRHMSQWDFEDFSTPAKPSRPLRAQEVRHFGWGADDENDNTPPARPRAAAQPRRDAESHFEFRDDKASETEERQLPTRPKGALSNEGGHLYENNLYDESAKPAEHDGKAPLGNVSNGVGHKKNFDSHWSMADPDPSERPERENIPSEKDHKKYFQSNWSMTDPDPSAGPEPRENVPSAKDHNKYFQSNWSMEDPDPSAEQPAQENKKISGDRMKAVKMMDSSWDTVEDAAKEPLPQPSAASKRVSRNVNQRSWGFGDDGF